MQAARGASLTASDQATVEPSPARPRRPLLLFALVAATAYALDVVTKQLALRHLADGDVAVLGDWFVLHLTHNPGAAFSTGTRYTLVFSVLAVVAVCVVLWVSRRVGSLLWAVGLGLLLAGVAGNLTDRIVRDPGPMRGHVIDFLMLPNWPVFNIADICINVAAGVIILQSFRGIRVDGRTDEAEDADDTPTPPEAPEGEDDAPTGGRS